MLAARKKFTFNAKEYLPGDSVPEKLLDRYQRETFLRAGFVVEKSAKPRKPVEVKPVEA